MTKCAVPADVAQAVCDRWPARGRSWLRQVAAELDELSQRYTASPIGVFRARYGFVIELGRDDASPLVMRATPDPDGHFQAGASLAELAELLRPLVADQPHMVGLPHLVPWLRGRLATGKLADLPPGLGPAPVDERERGRALLADLDDGRVEALCHGDCSRENVLRSGVGLELIDPRGMVGDIAYDVAVLAAKTANSPAGLAQLLGIDPDRAQAWAVVAGAARV